MTGPWDWQLDEPDWNEFEEPPEDEEPECYPVEEDDDAFFAPGLEVQS